MMIKNVAQVSLTTSIVILLLLVFAKLFGYKYSARGRYVLWIIIALRLALPFELPKINLPVRVDIPYSEREIILTTEGNAPLMVVQTQEADRLRQNYRGEDSARYATVATLKDLLTAVWATGTVIFVLYHLGAYFIFRLKIKKHLVFKENGVYSCCLLETPVLVGFFNSIIIMPLEDYTQEETQIIIEHEKMHKKRGDLWIKLLLVIANAVHWFNPIVYLMVSRANKDLEYSCDEAVVKGKDTQYRKLYSMTILKTMGRQSEREEKE